MAVKTTIPDCTISIVDTSGDAVVAVAYAIAGALGCDPLDVTPLANTLDADALNGLVDTGGLTSLSFTHDDCFVSISGRGTVTAQKF